MRDKHNTREKQTKRPAHIQMMLTGLTIALVAFAADPTSIMTEGSKSNNRAGCLCSRFLCRGGTRRGNAS
jgi:hypothetical protein